ncbi:MAG: hydroxymethylglutaryl-CoA reductase, degradative [Flavobacteriaceae bacterium]|nr:hydroxymethylglutaryl-CoA reductase, degradative [Flavobacteriaceae bacterium]
MKPISGFSKLDKKEKINWLTQHYLQNDKQAKKTLKQYWNEDAELQRLHDEFSENTISNYYLPYGIAPNFLINGKLLALPLAIEESSVVAAASKAAKFWLDRGGFHTQILGNKKLGHVHFMFHGDKNKLQNFFDTVLKNKLHEETAAITKNMIKRGGGILSLELKDKTLEIPHYFQIEGKFDTKDSMGANFINSCLEQFAKTMEREISESAEFSKEEKNSLQVVMCILSNFTPENMVRAEVRCQIEELAEEEMDAMEFVEKFALAVRIAEVEPYRATTHNKGIMNGIDALVIATGNDFRAVEACAHTYAARNGKYQSLTHCEVKDGVFRFWLDLPIALGTVGGLTSLHPLVKFSLNLLDNPDAQELMGITAVAGLAQNFAALRSLTTDGIQKGHMKMHLFNILNQLGANQRERDYFTVLFRDKTVTHHAVVEEFMRLRKINNPEDLNQNKE